MNKFLQISLFIVVCLFVVNIFSYTPEGAKHMCRCNKKNYTVSVKGEVIKVEIIKLNRVYYDKATKKIVREYLAKRKGSKDINKKFLIKAYTWKSCKPIILRDKKTYNITGEGNANSIVKVGNCDKIIRIK